MNKRKNRIGLTIAGSLAAGAAALAIGAGSASAFTWYAPPHGYGSGLQPRAYECTEGIPCINDNGLLAQNGIQGPYAPLNYGN